MTGQNICEVSREETLDIPTGHRKAVEEKKPKVHIFGHIYGGAEIFDNGVTRFFNAAHWSLIPDATHPPGFVEAENFSI